MTGWTADVSGVFNGTYVVESAGLALTTFNFIATGKNTGTGGTGVAGANIIRSGSAYSERGLAAQISPTSIQLKNSMAGFLYRDFSGAPQTSGSIKVILKR